MTPKCAKCGNETPGTAWIMGRVSFATGRTIGIDDTNIQIVCDECIKKLTRPQKRIGPSETKGGNDGEEATGDGTTV